METYGKDGYAANAQQEVSTPAILLIVTGALNALYSLWNMVSAVFNREQVEQILDTLRANSDLAPVVGFIESMASTAVSVLFALIALGLSALIIFGGLKMKNLESRGLAMVAAILAIIPCCNGCYCLGIPAGIWALVVLNKPEVKAAFRS
jgi:uncharacterized membrane protein HdeD (DUF308 family)